MQNELLALCYGMVSSTQIARSLKNRAETEVGRVGLDIAGLKIYLRN